MRFAPYLYLVFRWPGLFLPLVCLVHQSAFSAEKFGSMSARLGEATIDYEEQDSTKSPRIALVFGPGSVVVTSSAASETQDGIFRCPDLIATETVLNGRLLSEQLAETAKPFPAPAWFFSSGTGYYFYSDETLSYSTTSSSPGRVDLLVQTGQPPDSSTGKVLIQTGVSDASKMQDFVTKMQVRLTAPMQIMQNDQRAAIVFDRDSQTTGYVILKANDRMNSEGYLNGASQVCALLLHSDGKTLQLAAGIPAATTKAPLRFKLFGNWAPAASEKKIISCQRQAGRTWIEFVSAPGGSSQIEMIRLPDAGFVQWVRGLWSD